MLFWAPHGRVVSPSIEIKFFFGGALPFQVHTYNDLSMEDTEFKKLIEEYLAGNLNDDEERRLFDRYDELQNSTSVWDASLMGSKASVHEKLYARILKEIKMRRRKVVVPLVAAAALLVLIPLGILFYPDVKQEIPVKTYSQQDDVAPGGDKALLILADGSEIALDKAKNGDLTKQGEIRIHKTEDGQVVYINAKGQRAPQSIAPKYNTIRTPKTGQYKVVLADGTKVWLNAVSSIRFPTSFTHEERRVEITGEAYFEVAKDKNRPFRVITPEQTIEVLGTRFNINAYQGEKAVKTTLLEGSVKVSPAHQKGREHQSILLHPGQQSTVTPNSSHIEVKNVDTEEIIAWKNGYFQFNNTDIAMIMRQVERWYDVEVVYEGGAYENRLSGKISRDVSVSKVLEMLHYLGINAEIEGRKITITN